jgi:hypothetical protein
MKSKQELENMLSERTHDAKVFMYVLGMLEDLSKKGLVKAEPGASRLTKEGYEAYKILKEQGFTPSQDEINEAMHWILNPPSDECDCDHSMLENGCQCGGK